MTADAVPEDNLSPGEIGRIEEIIGPLKPGQKVDPEIAKTLFTPHKLGPFDLSNRIVYAPLTRCRAAGTIPQPNAVTYYSQRAHKGSLLLTEATCIAQEGHGYPNTPGIYSREQIEAWKPIVSAVKAKGAVFFLQLWHVGRASHPEYQPNGALPVSSSATPITSGEKVYTSAGAVDFVLPRALEKEEIAARVDLYRVAARNAIEAGFDGVEVHGANGYLIDQFLKDGINKRTDEYGGSVENRARFALEVVQAVADEIGAERVGIRISPFGGFLDSHDSDPYATNLYLVEQLNKIGIAYVHGVEPRVGGNDDREVPEGWTLDPIRKAFKGSFIAAGGYKRDNSASAIKSNHADLVALGRWFLANPDLPRRFALDAPLNKYDRNTFYVLEPVKGYIDYPFLDE